MVGRTSLATHKPHPSAHPTFGCTQTPSKCPSNLWLHQLLPLNLKLRVQLLYPLHLQPYGWKKGMAATPSYFESQLGVADNLKARLAKGVQCYSSTFLASELQEAEVILFARSQQHCFTEELQKVSAGTSLKPSSPLVCVTPTISSGGLLRVGGRLAHSSLSYSQQHPVILHGRDPLTKLYVHS